MRTYTFFLSLLLCLSAAACGGAVETDESSAATVAISPSGAGTKGTPAGPAEAVRLSTGYELSLPPGLDQTVRDRLADGEVAYPVLLFSAPPGREEIDTLAAEGVDLLDPLAGGAYQARVTPGGLPTLEALVAEGSVRSARALPPAAKVGPELAEARSGAPAGERLAVVVRLHEAPTKAQRAQLATNLEIENESAGALYLLEGHVANGDLDALLAIPVVREVTARALSEPGNTLGGE